MILSSLLNRFLATSITRIDQEILKIYIVDHTDLHKSFYSKPY